jgi:hypothetical protein
MGSQNLYQDLSLYSTGEELNVRNLDYDHSEYPSLDTLLAHVRDNSDKEPVKPDTAALSVNGTVIQDPMETYLSAKGLSSGCLKEALKSPLSYYVYSHETFPPKDGKHFELGTFAHLAFLEPELFDKVAVAPEGCSMATKDGVTKMINFYRSLKGEGVASFSGDYKMQDLKDLLEREKSECQYQVIDAEHKIIIDAMKRYYYTYGGGIIPKLMRGAISEVSMYGKNEYGMDVKIRPDAINIAENIGVDAIISIKTTRADSIGKYIYDVARLKYEVSEGFYQQVASNITGRKFNTTIMIVLQTIIPFQPIVFYWTADALEVGKYKANIAQSIIAECTEKNLFPGMDAKAPAGNYGIYELELPEWACKEEPPVAIDDYDDV